MDLITTPPSESFHRSLWRRIEAVHAVTYFGHETRDAGTAAGLRGFWMGYFGFRASPLGTATTEAVERAFYNFAPAFVARSVPAVWAHSQPDDLVRLRSAAAAATLRRCSTRAEETATAVEPLLRDLADDCDQPARPLYVANRQVRVPDDPVERLWQWTTSIREHRGDGHVAALLAAGLDGCEALVLISVDQSIPGQRFRDSRGWTDGEWEATAARLTERGLLAPDGSISTAGRRLRDEVEVETDRLAAPLTASLDAAVREQLVRALDPLASDITASGLIPFPNPIGLPPPR